jgi:signal transduction histidine kinase
MRTVQSTRGRLVADSLLALAVLAVSQIEVWAPSVLAPESIPGPRWAVGLSQAIVCGSIAFRRVRPFAALAIASGAQLVEAAAYGANQGIGTFLPFAILVYSVAAYEDRVDALAGLAVTIVGSTAHELLDPLREEGGLTDTLPYYVVILMVWGTGRIVARQRALDRERATVAATLEQERGVLEAAAVKEERARIARELHDVVSHSLGVVAVQAEAAADILGEDPAYVSSALERIQTTARQGLDDMRRMVGVLRPEWGDPLEPQPGVDGLEQLVADVRETGLEVALEIQGDPTRVPPGTGVSVYRIVQESLTNAVRHARATRVQVRVALGDTVDVRVTDDGDGVDPDDGTTGYGLVGMRERVTLAGGTLEVGPREPRGFGVHAVLPLRGDT